MTTSELSLRDLTQTADLAGEPAHVLAEQGERVFLVTGGAGFIGSHIVEALLRAGQRVRVVDNLATSSRTNLEEVAAAVARERGDAAAARLAFVEGDVCDAALMKQACTGVDVVLHQAGLGSVPRSLADPRATHAANVDGFVTALLAARDAGVSRFVYASSSSVYGDHAELPKVEARIGRPLSPYAATKLVDEIYAGTMQDAFGIECVGLRYFNVFGPRQDPSGPYAAVIPLWVRAMLAGVPCAIHGDGSNSRDFCYVQNAVQANLRAALAPSSSTNTVVNVACGARTTLSELHALLKDALVATGAVREVAPPRYGPPRAGDVPHSLADIDKARALLGYVPSHDVKAGIAAALPWYVAHAARFDAGRPGGTSS